jgi:hypothetical protein
MCAAPEHFLSGKSERKKRPADSLEMPPKLTELMLSYETTKMQANLLPRGEDIVLRECFLTVAIDTASSIHIRVTKGSDRSWVRIVPDRDTSVRPMFCSHRGPTDCSIRSRRRDKAPMDRAVKQNWSVWTHEV